LKPKLGYRFIIASCLCGITIIYSCSKGGGTGGGGTPPNPCNGVVITVTGTTVNPGSSVTADGSISASASGSGLTFNINGGAFQGSGNFTNLLAGTYTIVAKNTNGCTGSAVFTLTAPNLCSGTTINVSGVANNNTPCGATGTGTITVTAAGGTGTFVFNIDGGTFQTSNVFNNLNGGAHLIAAKDANGCIGAVSVTVGNQPPGPLFSAVRTLIQTECVGCHNNGQSEGGMNFSIDCNIIINRDRIKIRAVDGNPSFMPPTGALSVTDRQKITNWINAGGQFTN
jgi:hypothetical protein